MPRDIVVEYTDYTDAASKPVRIVVARANGYMGMRRSMLTFQAVQHNEQTKELDPSMAVLRTMTYPDLIAATKEATGIPWPCSFDEFIELPDDLISLWENATYEVNPHWNPPPESDEKKG